VGTPTFHMRQTVATAVKNKLRRRRDNTLDLESRLNMGIRDTAKRRSEGGGARLGAGGCLQI